MSFLNWIHREAAAFENGDPPPVFEATNGESIFPDRDEEWWLTDVQKRKNQEDVDGQGGDEDGPASSDGEAKALSVDAAVSDGDEDSDFGDEHGDNEGDAGPLFEAGDGMLGTDLYLDVDVAQPAGVKQRQAPLSLWRPANKTEATDLQS